MLFVQNYVVNIGLLVLMTTFVDSKTISTDVALLTDQDSVKQNETSSDKSVMPRKTEARDTRWSYFYVGSWVWHFPLWFLIYFVWYLIFCTVRSIYNHTVSRLHNFFTRAFLIYFFFRF